MRFSFLFIFPALSFFIGSVNLQAQTDNKNPHHLNWYVDIMKANEESGKTNKPIFAFFTGSDWCGWCKRIESDVFAKKEFIEWAKNNVVLLELDFPRGKQLPPELVQQNNSLQQTFQVLGYPTIWIFKMVKNEAVNNYNIEALGSLGYPAGAVKGKEQDKFLQQANEILSKMKK